MPRVESIKKQDKIKALGKDFQGRNWEFVLLRCETPNYPIIYRYNSSYCSWSSMEDGFGTYSIEGYIQFPSARRKSSLQTTCKHSVWNKAYRSPVYIESALRHKNSYGVINADKRHWLVPQLVISQPSRQSQDELLRTFVDNYRSERDAYCHRLSALLLAAENPPVAPSINGPSDISPHIFMPFIPPPSSISSSNRAVLTATQEDLLLSPISSVPDVNDSEHVDSCIYPVDLYE